MTQYYFTPTPYQALKTFTFGVNVKIPKFIINTESGSYLYGF